MSRTLPLLALLTCSMPALASDTGGKALTLPATLELPGRASSATTSPTEPAEFFTSFLRPSKRVVMVGEPKPKDLLPMSGTPCTCDHDRLTCVISSSGARLQWRGTAADWPLASGLLGTCETEDVVFPVSVDLSSMGSSAWWRGLRELVVPVASRRTSTTTVKQSVWDNVPVAPRETSEGPVRCQFDGDARQVAVRVAPDAEPGLHPCLSWSEGAVSVRVVAAPR